VGVALSQSKNVSILAGVSLLYFKGRWSEKYHFDQRPLVWGWSPRFYKKVSLNQPQTPNEKPGIRSIPAADFAK
jgi:hypothetical protein